MCRSLWQTPAALTLISTCVPAGCGVGWSTSLKGALNSATWKLFMASLPMFLPYDQTDTLAVYLGQGMMASHVLACRHGAKFGHFAGASLVGARAAGAETAARGRRDRRWRLAGRNAFGRPHVRVGHRNRLDQQRGIGMRGPGKQLLRRTDLAQPAEIHHRDAVADRLHHREIVGDEQQRQSEARLHLFQQIQDLRANRNVERRDRLVADDELGVEHQCPRDADALALSAGKFMRQPP